MIVSYQRVSTNEQQNSIDASTTQIQKYCEYRELTLDKSFIDFGVSGGRFDREQFVEMIELVKQGQIKCIVIQELARWGRSMLESLEHIEILKKHNCNLIVLKENIELNNSSGTLFFNILLALGQWEKEQVSYRVKTILQDKKEKGLQYTRTTYGYDMIEGKMVENPTELRMLKKVEKLKEAGKSYNEIKEFLNRNDYIRKNGSNWNRDSVIKLVKNRLKITNSMTTN